MVTIDFGWRALTKYRKFMDTSIKTFQWSWLDMLSLVSAVVCVRSEHELTNVCLLLWMLFILVFGITFISNWMQWCNQEIACHRTTTKTFQPDCVIQSQSTICIPTAIPYFFSLCLQIDIKRPEKQPKTRLRSSRFLFSLSLSTSLFLCLFVFKPNQKIWRKLK